MTVLNKLKPGLREKAYEKRASFLELIKTRALGRANQRKLCC